jgi:hypothetical protein
MRFYIKTLLARLTNMNYPPGQYKKRIGAAA